MVPACKRARETSEILELGGHRYALYGRTLLQLLADGAVGPVVGHIDSDGAVTIDEEAASGEWVGELLTATRLDRNGPCANMATVPAEIIAAVRNGAAAEWRGAMDAATVKSCREELQALEVEGHLRFERACDR